MAECSEKKEISVCEKHGEYESKAFVLPFGNDRIIWSSCPECQKEQKEAEKVALQKGEKERRERYIRNTFDEAGIPHRFRDRTFDTYIADTKEKQGALEIAKNFARDINHHLEKGTTLIFSGNPGTGKTHLSCAIANSLIFDYSVRYSSAIDLIRAIRETWRKDSNKSEREVLNAISSIDLLIIDEIGVQFGTEAEQVHLFDIIDKRYRDMMPTIFLTNLGTGGMKEFLGDRSYDRLREDGIWVACKWESHRGK